MAPLRLGELLEVQERPLSHAVTGQRTGICWIANTRVALDRYTYRQWGRSQGLNAMNMPLSLLAIQAFKVWRKGGYYFNKSQFELDVATPFKNLMSAIRNISQRHRFFQEELALAQAISGFDLRLS